MFLLTLGGSLVLGAGLLAAASYSEGTFLALRTAAQAVGWLLLLATVVGIQGLRHATFGALGTATVTFVSGVAVLYMAYFEWGEMPQAAIRHAAAAEALPVQQIDYKLVDDVFVAKTVAFVSEPEVAAVAVKEIPPLLLPVTQQPAGKITDPCPALAGVELLQCRRCAQTEGLRWLLCQESVRLEYCEGRQDDQAACPATVAFTPPG